MTTETIKQSRSWHELWEIAYSGFLRLLAIFFIVFTFQIWMKAIGIASDPNVHFATMEPHWRSIVAALCVLHPLTALGLWGLFSWGIAVWLLNVLIQMSMYLLFSNLYGYDQIIVIFHAVCLGIFVIFQLALRITNNK